MTVAAASKESVSPNAMAAVSSAATEMAGITTAGTLVLLLELNVM